MKMPNWVMNKLRRFAFRIVEGRPPDQRIGGLSDQDASPYMERWILLPKNRFLNIYIHNFLRSDDDRALHDHPWPSLSFLLLGSYREHSIVAGGCHHQVEYHEGEMRYRPARFAHRMAIIDDKSCCYTLFIIGPHIREWGFHCPSRGWLHWTKFGNGCQ